MELRKRRAEKHASLYGDAPTTKGGGVRGGSQEEGVEGEGGEGETSMAGAGKPPGGGGNSRRGWQLARLHAHQALLELV